MTLKPTLGVAAAAVLAGAIAAPAEAFSLSRLGTYTGAGAEISAYDPATKRLFVTTGDTFEILDLSTPSAPSLIKAVDVTGLGGGVNSVAFKNGVLAAAIGANVVTDPGVVAFYTANGDLLGAPVTVGALPDMVTFTPDGSKVLVANEGEPSEDYTVDPEGSVSIIDVASRTLIKTAGFTQFNSATLDPSIIISRGNATVAPRTVAQDLEPEYITVSEDGLTAYVALQENNALGVLDIAAGEFTDLLGLGFKDHSQVPLDASNRDGGINIRTYSNLLGIYMPDAIASFTGPDGETYIVTANEGDSRVRPTGDDEVPGLDEGDIFSNEVRVEDIDLDPTAFPDPTVQDRANLGRLKVHTELGDTDGDGDYDQLYAFGGRSFSIFDSKGNLVFDSGADFEQIIAAQIPELFNSDESDPDEFDSRSDDKGPEPEGVVIAKVDNKVFAIVGLERVGGVMVYNITNPKAAQFVTYVPSAPGDAAPEGLTFIDGADSPTGQPLLVVTNEASSTVTVYGASVPEPGTVLGLLSVAAAGIWSRRRHTGSHQS